MKAQLRKLEDIAVSQGAQGASGNSINIKEEPSDTLYGQNFRGNRGRSRGGRSRPRGGRLMQGANRFNNPTMDFNMSPNRPQQDGRASKCFICKSTMHWVRNCPHQSDARNNDAYYEEEVHITLFSKGLSDSAHTGKLLSETIGCAVLDSGCTRNVCSDKWLDCYIQSLSNEQQSMITYEESNKKFRFGDMSTLTSMIC